MLTTPELNDSDSVFPGENWFFYWKTSPSLWESKLQNYQGVRPLFVPIYWGLHSEHPDHYDFAKRVPETDLKKIASIAEDLRIEIIFILFIGPAPFLPNGGIPSYLSRSLALDQRGVGRAVINNEGKVNKLFSFYDPRIFQAFKKFIWHLSRYFYESKITQNIYGAKSYYTQNGRFEEYLLDTSKIFEQGFSRYIKNLQDKEPEKLVGIETNYKVELDLKKEFKSMLFELYETACLEIFPNSFQGILSFNFIGGAQEDVFSRSSEIWEGPSSYLQAIFDTLSSNYFMSTILLPKASKKQIVDQVVSSLYTESYVQKKMNNALFNEELSSSFSPLFFFSIFLLEGDYYFRKNYLKELGLLAFFKQNFNQTFLFNTKFEEDEESDDDSFRAYFYFGVDLKMESVIYLLKQFMNGKKIFLDTSLMEDELLKRIDLFLLENNISTEKINYLTAITKAELGEGLLFLYDGTHLKGAPYPKKMNFWSTLIKYINIKHVGIEAEEGVHFFWAKRLSSSLELSYEEMRRVHFFNPTSYKKKVELRGGKNFAFIKVLDEIKSSVKSTPFGVEVEMLPMGSVALDFGYYE